MWFGSPGAQADKLGSSGRTSAQKWGPAPRLEQVRPAGTHSLWDFATAALRALCSGLAVPVLLWRARAS